MSCPCQSFYMAISCLSKVQTLSSAQTRSGQRTPILLEAVMSKSPWQLLLQMMSLLSLSPSAFVHVASKCNIFLSQCSGHQCADAKDTEGENPDLLQRTECKKRARSGGVFVGFEWCGGVVLMALWNRLCERSLCHSLMYTIQMPFLTFGTVVV